MNVSKSKIKSLENCPLSFKWQHIDHRVPDIPPAAITRIGLDVHDIFNKFFDNIKFGEIPDEPLEYFQNAMMVLPQYKGIYDLFCLHQARRWKKLIEYNRRDEFIPLLREHKIINNDETGIIDCVYLDGDNYAVLDYKSSAHNATDLRFELCFYKKVVDDSRILDKPVAYIGAYGYKDGSFFYENINTRSYNVMLKKVEDFKALDFSTMEFRKNPGWSCSWCSYILSCNKL